MINSELLTWLRCPVCQGDLRELPDELYCVSCATSYAYTHNTPSFYGLLATEPQSPKGHDVQNPAHWSVWRKKNYEYFRRALEDIQESAVVIDVGAGQAHFARLLQSYTHYSVDFQSYPGIDVLTDLTRPLPIQSDYFDVVMLSNVLEHIPVPERLLKEIHRILKTDGKLLMTTPFLIKIHQAPYDFLRYTEYMYRYLFERVGFKQYTIHPIGNIVYVDSIVSGSLRRWLLKAEKRFWKRVILRVLLRMSRELVRASLGFAGGQKSEAPDTIGFPFGYGCIAVK